MGKKGFDFLSLNAECPLLSDLIGDDYKQLCVKHEGPTQPGTVLGASWTQFLIHGEAQRCEMLS